MLLHEQSAPAPAHAGTFPERGRLVYPGLVVQVCSAVAGYLLTQQEIFDGFELVGVLVVAGLLAAAGKAATLQLIGVRRCERLLFDTGSIWDEKKTEPSSSKKFD